MKRFLSLLASDPSYQHLAGLPMLQCNRAKDMVKK